MPSAVATFPPMICASGKCLRIFFTISNSSSESPWAISTTMQSAPACRAASTRRISLSRTPTAAPTAKRPFESLVAFGNLVIFMMSFKVTKPVTLPSLSTSGSFSTRCSCSKRSASLRDVFGGALRTSRVMIAVTGLLSSSSKSRSRVVMMPTSFPSLSTIKMPPVSVSSTTRFTSPTVCWSVIVSGFSTMKDSAFLTRSI